MDFGKLLLIYRRRFILTTVLLTVTLAGASIALVHLPRTYQSESSVVLLASRSAARPTGRNPYLSFSSSLTLTADVVSQELMAPGIGLSLAAMGVPSTYTVALAPVNLVTTGSVLLVTVTGHDQGTVERALPLVTSEISVVLSQLQAKVSPRNRIRAATISFAPQAVLQVSQLARQIVILVAASLLLALGIPVIVDGRTTRRRLRDAPLSPADKPTYETIRR